MVVRKSQKDIQKQSTGSIGGKKSKWGKKIKKKKKQHYATSLHVDF